MSEFESGKFFRPLNAIESTQGNLPHWHQSGTVTFVTFRLADSLPGDFWIRWNAERTAWLRRNPAPLRDAQAREYNHLFIRPLSHRLDDGHGSGVLAEPEARRIVEEALRHFDGTRLTLDEFVVATNHVHALITPLGSWRLNDLMRSIKGFSAKRILENAEMRERLMQHQPSREHPRVWQPESFDHLVRSEGELEKIREYIRNHPTYGRS